MPTGFRAYRVLLSVLFFLVTIASVSGEARQQVAGKSAQSASAPVPNALSSDVSKYVGRDLPDVSRRSLQQLGEDTALKDDA
jgi:hypothetical protein